MAGPTGASVPGRSFLVRVWPPAPFLVRWDGRSFLVRGLAPGSVRSFVLVRSLAPGSVHRSLGWAFLPGPGSGPRLRRRIL